MAESLEDFLEVSRNVRMKDVTQCSLACAECDEIVHSGKLNEEDFILHYTCSSGHNSRVKL